MIVADPAGGLDGSLKVEDVERLAENNVILVVEAVEAELGQNGSALVFEGVSLGVEFGGLHAQQSAYVVV
jgi:hypothetical protein